MSKALELLLHILFALFSIFSTEVPELRGSVITLKVFVVHYLILDFNFNFSLLVIQLCW